MTQERDKHRLWLVISLLNLAVIVGLVGTVYLWPLWLSTMQFTVTFAGLLVAQCVFAAMVWGKQPQDW